jgi:hypothetical protein
MMKNEESLLKWLQGWYHQYCDGDWEHDERFIIETIDNPGWMVSINVEGTDCEGEDFEGIKIERSAQDWYHCFIRDGKFKGAGGPFNLEDILNVFKNWTIACKNKQKL